jgi:hypothetical protein
MLVHTLVVLELQHKLGGDQRQGEYGSRTPVPPRVRANGPTKDGEVRQNIEDIND